MTNENKIHGASISIGVPLTDELKAHVTDADEFVYAAEEYFEDGHVSLKICWRPRQKPKQANADVPTYLTSVAKWKVTPEENKYLIWKANNG